MGLILYLKDLKNTFPTFFVKKNSFLTVNFSVLDLEFFRECYIFITVWSAFGWVHPPAAPLFYVLKNNNITVLILVVSNSYNVVIL